MSDTKTGFKGFDKNWKCQDYQFEVGKTYTHDGEVKLCSSGFHFCEHPLDVFEYYTPNESRFAEVEALDVSDQTDGDTKRVCKTLRIKAELTIRAMIDMAIKFTFDKADWSKKENHVTGDNEGSKTKDVSGAASATGIWGAASATGYRGAASATGIRGAASATGIRGAASATGDSGAASATGIRGAASATGDSGAASATGIWGAASATGIWGAASATGIRGAASATGIRGAASATGDSGAASATGIWGAASATGIRGAASATGKESCAVSIGLEGTAKAAKGCWITLAEWEFKNGVWHRADVQTKRVDGEKVKAETWYMLKSGKFVEAK
jgi:hypothetical protein